ncbi:acid protease [Trametes coccinea BRFM310]|uniref:Acid protease n=1 Tax=Trametes coccinea (strain BRFM310) TaxID=1353009 RepID=A0A1Y2J2F3_TRAC3|nr:acid protease [Trametes coccinea BRFM310]
MQLALSFTTLLASVLFVLSATSNVEAAPAKRGSRAVTLPLTRIHQNRGDVHPQVLLQQHINRGLKRYARMKGREPPSKREMEEKIAKRMFIPEGGRPKFNANSKRYNRKGAAKVNALETADTVSDTFEAFAKGLKEAAQGGKGKKHKQAQAQAAASGNSTGTGATDADNGSLTAANPPTASNSLGLDIEAQDVGYIATIQMGTPPRDFHILMDSGSADLWVGAEGCQSQGGGGCGNHQFLGTQSSSTFKDLGQQFQVTYGTGAVAGDVVQDNINVAGLALNGHTFGVAAEETVDFSSDTVPFDGLMGLAQSTLSEQGVPTPVEALAKAGLIDDAITSYKISRLADNKNDGEITFGALDQTKFDPSTLVTFPVVSQTGFWEGAMDAVSVDGQDLGLQGRTAILDTGTTLIVAPPADAAAVHQAIPGAQSDGQGGFIIPCSTNASVALTFGGQAFAIDTRDLVFQQLDQENCASGISSGEIDGETTWLVGDVFLKNAYFSTDVTKNTISLAKLV